MTEIDQKDIAIGLQAALNLAEDIQMPRRPEVSTERSQWVALLKPGDIIGLHTLYQGAFETIVERVTVYQLTDWGFFVLRDTGELRGLLDIDKNGYVPAWGKMGWIAELD